MSSKVNDLSCIEIGEVIADPELLQSLRDIAKGEVITLLYIRKSGLNNEINNKEIQLAPCAFSRQEPLTSQEEGTLANQTVQNFLHVCLVLDKRAFLDKRRHFSWNLLPPIFLHSRNDVIPNRTVLSQLKLTFKPKRLSTSLFLRVLVYNLWSVSY